MPIRQLFDTHAKKGSEAELAQGSLSQTPGEYAWSESYFLLALVEMYETTGETRYLDQMIARFEVLLSLRDDRTGRRDELKGRVMAAWGSSGYTEGRYTCWLCHAGMLSFPAARFARLVRETAALQENYSVKAQAFAAAVEATVAAYESDWREGPAEDEGYYMALQLKGKHLPTNQQNSMGRVLLDLAVATGQKAYRERAARLATFLKRRLQLRPDGAYEWSYWPPLEPPYFHGPEDISHAAINVDFAVRCCRDRLVFGPLDMDRMATTFLKVISRGNREFADDVSGGGGGKMTGEIGRWGHLAERDRTVADLIQDHFRNPGKSFTGFPDSQLLGLAILARYQP